MVAPMLHDSLRWWSAAALAEAANGVSGPWSEWCRDWGFEGGQVVAFNAFEVVSGKSQNWSPGRGGSAAYWQCQFAPCASARLRTAWFGAEGRGDARVARAVCDRAVAQWCERLAEAELFARGQARGVPATPPATVWRPWSGALIVDFLAMPGSVHVMQVLIPADVAISGLGQAHRRPNVPSRQDASRRESIVDAVQGRTVKLEVRLAPATIDIGSLLGLRSGDVVKTGHPINAPLRVDLADRWVIDSPPLCVAWLGQSGGRTAAMLAGGEQLNLSGVRDATDPQQRD